MVKELEQTKNVYQTRKTPINTKIKIKPKTRNALASSFEAPAGCGFKQQQSESYLSTVIESG
jgi:hypothetical protein